MLFSQLPWLRSNHDRHRSEVHLHELLARILQPVHGGIGYRSQPKPPSTGCGIQWKCPLCSLPQPPRAVFPAVGLAPAVAGPAAVKDAWWIGRGKRNAQPMKVIASGGYNENWELSIQQSRQHLGPSSTSRVPPLLPPIPGQADPAAPLPPRARVPVDRG